MIKNLPYYQLELPEIFETLNTSQEGISDIDVQQRRQLYGENTLTELHRESALQKFLKQFKDALIVLLMIATVISIYLHDYRGASILGALLLINACIGYFQEAKAERIMQSLKKMLHPVAKVKRDGKIIEVKASELVPGDVVFVDE
jgi:Ca2+-transporting ATPase